MTQKFKGAELTTGLVVDNILGFYSSAEEFEYNNGMLWYSRANELVTEMGWMHGLSTAQAAGIVAAFSPQCSWDTNLEYAEEYMRTGSTGRTRHQLSIADKISKLETVKEIRAALSVSDDGSPKVKAFFDCILDPYCDSVVVDRHAIACALQSPTSVGVLNVNMQSITLKQYDFLADAYTKAANKVGVMPNQMQAITWETYRSIRKLRKHKTQAA